MMTEAIPIAHAIIRIHFRKECGCMLIAGSTRSKAWSALCESRRPRREKIHHDRTNHMEVHLGRSTLCASACRGVTSWRTRALTDLGQVPVVVPFAAIFTIEEGRVEEGMGLRSGGVVTTRWICPNAAVVTAR